MKSQHFKSNIHTARSAALQEILDITQEITSLSEGLCVWLEDENSFGRPLNLRRADEALMEIDALIQRYKERRDARAFVNEG